MANPQIDLSVLTVERTYERADLRLPRRWFSRVVLPVGLIAGFTALFVYASWDYLAPSVPVTIVPVLARTGTVETSGQELFKANGWIEPRPSPTDVPVQTDGMYRAVEVAVVPGDRVTAGQLLVRFDDERAKLDYLTAQRRLDRRKAAQRAAQADLSRAEVTVRNAEASIALATQEGAAEVKTLNADVARAVAMQKSAELAVQVEERLRQSGGLNSDIKLLQARQQFDVAVAETRSAEAKVEKAQITSTVRVRQAELAKASAAADAVSLKAKVDESGHEAADAEVDVSKSQLELSRTRLTAPVDGVVMQLNVRVGSIMGGKSTAIEHKDAAVTLYDPARLQVRVEVPISKFALVRPGQPAVIEIEDVLPGIKLQGLVLSDTHFANVARNSVPVKVALPDGPPPQLRPEMIASVRFISPKGTSDAPKSETVRRLIVPRRLVRMEGEQAKIWIVDASTGRAVQRTIELVPGPQIGDVAEVVSGLQPTDKLIASNLEQMSPGLRVKVTGEER